ncbi:DUF1738 domain-containing protein [Candidatus Pacearchaeota archaeon]|nr:DUF1738 domain-containing protein [Candidatus Pacearchaeota archaeon]
MRNVYQIITDRIISKLEEGTVPWHRPWGVRGIPRSLVSGKEYRGINSFVLSSAGYEALYWLSYKQAKERRGFVKKGQQGYPCVYWNWLEMKDEETNEIKKVPFLRYYTVFNVEQCENIEYPKGDGLEFLFDPIEHCERIVGEMPNPPSIRQGGSRARYIPIKDTIEMPRPESFETSESYYSVLFHELAGDLVRSLKHCPG